MSPISRREWFKTSLAGVGAVAALGTPAEATSASAKEFSFHYDHIIGTSLDVWLTAKDEAAATQAEEAMLGEIDRLNAIFSTYESHSELSRLNRSSGAVTVSPELFAVLKEYQEWQIISGGACNAQVGAFVNLWTEAAKSNTLPNTGNLSQISQEITRTSWHLNESQRTVTRLSPHALNLNSLAKGYIIYRAVEVARSVPGVVGGLVDIGGDMTAFGSQSYAIGLQDPFSPAENARPLGGFSLKAGAVATSGSYQRFHTIQGKQYSHLIDPRTGMPADAIVSATILCESSPVANALATTTAVMSVGEALRLVGRYPGAEAFFVDNDGKHHATAGFPLLPVEPTKPALQQEVIAKADDWQTGYQVTVKLELPTISAGARYRKPYVAVWIEDGDGKPVRTLAVWGASPKYMKDLSDWWKFAKEDQTLRALAKATRGPGKYTLEWDGKDDKGKALSQGTYTVRVEVHREHGKHLRQSGKIDCKADAAEVKFDKNDESGEVVVAYAKKK